MNTIYKMNLSNKPNGEVRYESTFKVLFLITIDFYFIIDKITVFYLDVMNSLCLYPLNAYLVLL